MKLTKKDIGKKVGFKSLTRWNSGKAIRKIKDIRKDGCPLVRFGGWSEFAIRPNEIIRIFK